MEYCSSHSVEKTPQKISSPNTTETGIINEKNTENKVENKISESGSLSNFAILRAKSTGNTEEKLVGTSSLSNSEKLEVDNIENKDEKLSVGRSSSNPTNKEDTNKFKSDEKSLQNSSCSNLRKVSIAEDNGEIISFESSFLSSHTNIEDKSKEETSENNSLCTLTEFKLMLNTKNTEEKTSAKESVIPEGCASLPSTSLQEEAMKVCAYGPNIADKRRKSGYDKDFFGKLTELQRAAGQISDPAVAAAALTHAAGGESRSSQNSTHNPDPNRRPEYPVQQSDRCKAVSVDGIEVDCLNEIQECYETLCCSEGALFSHVMTFLSLGFCCLVSIFWFSRDPSLFPYVPTFTILGVIFFILFFISLVKLILRLHFSG